MSPGNGIACKAVLPWAGSGSSQERRTAPGARPVWPTESVFREGPEALLPASHQPAH